MADLEDVLQEEVDRRRRAYRRVDRPTMSWGYGLLLLVALGSLFVAALTVVAKDIEGEVERTARRALDRAGLEDVRVSADGQNLLVEGADDAQLLEAVDLLVATRFRSWMGNVKPAGEVSSQSEALLASSEPPSASPGGESERSEPSAQDRQAATDGDDDNGGRNGDEDGPAIQLATARGSLAKLSGDQEGGQKGARDAQGTQGTEDESQRDPQNGAKAGGPAAATVEPDVQMAAPHFLFIRNGAVLTLTGTMTNSMTRDALLATARAIVASDADRPAGLRTLEGDLAVSGSRSEGNEDPIDPMPAAVRGLALLRRCIEGRASLQGGVFRFRGAAPAEEVSVLSRSARAPISGTTIGLVEFDEVQRADRCEQLLSTAVADLKIEFVADSAVMQGAAADQLDRVAEVATTCILPLRIEGHATEQQGASRELSLKRAHAVRDALTRRGLEKDRLTVQGFGPESGSPSHTYPIAIRVLEP